MIELLEKISRIIFDWILDPLSGDYQPIYQNEGGGRGMLILLIILLGVSVLAVVIYYFIIAASLNNANRTNYIITCILGGITLVIANIVILKMTHPDVDCDFFTMNLLKINLLDVLYYVVLFEIWSLVLRPMSKDKHRDLISSFKK